MRETLFFSAALVLVCGTAPAASAAETGSEPIGVGSRLELFVDDYLIDKLAGGAELHLHKPEPQEVVFTTDKPWEGNTSAYFTIFRDGDRYRMYYRGSHFDTEKRKAAHSEVACYAESADGVHWTRPKLGLFEFDGSRANNIVWDGVGTHNFTPFRDANPACPADARYKALARGSGEANRGLYAFQSADGIHWRLMREEPVITEGAFDSQNLAFWDAVGGRYVDFHRGFREGVRDIMTSTSGDFLTWTEPEWLSYPGAPREHLYTNAIMAYERAPHVFLGFPTRFLPKTEQVEPTLMASRDGRTFHRWTEALIPLDAPEDRDGNRSNYMAWGLVRLPDDHRQYSVYATEGYYTGPAGRLRRFTYRVDGFASVRASGVGGELVTRPLVFAGNRLAINFAASEGGGVRVEIQDAAGKPIDGFALDDCRELQGDVLGQTVAWQSGEDVAALAGRPVRLRFALDRADLYSFRFVDPPNVGEADQPSVKSAQGERPKPVVAVDNVCAWPNLTVLRDGTIIATIFNQPSHGLMAGDVECWASEDGGATWGNRGTPAARESDDSVRMNVAAGLAGNGDLIVICSGWSGRDASGRLGEAFRERILPAWVSRSADGGRTWSVDKQSFPAALPSGEVGVPFGDILAGQDGFLRVAVYHTPRTYVYCSRDDGKTWGEPVVLDDQRATNETALLHLGGGKWLAAARYDGLELYRSDDDAKTWVHQKKVTGRQQHPGHLMRLGDGRLLLTYGNRVDPKGVDVRLSEDEGQTWGDPVRLVDFEGDGGYPSSVELPDGRVLTAYYARRVADHDRYHMGVVIWDRP